MEKNTWRKIYEAISYPKGWVLTLIYATTLTAVALSFTALFSGNEKTGFAIALYILALIFSAYSVFVTIKLVGAMHGKVLNVADRYAFTRKLHKDYAFRSLFFGAWQLALDCVFVVFLSITAFKAQTVWYFTLFGYYLLIAVVRGGVLLRTAKSETKYKDDFISLQLEKIKIYRRCGGVFLALALVLLSSVAQILSVGTRFPSPDGMIYAFGAYAIYRTATSLHRLIKTKKLEDLSASALQNLNFITSLVVLLTFQTVLLDSLIVNYPWLINGISGLALCVCVFLFGIYMLKRGKTAQRNIESRIKKEE